LAKGEIQKWKILQKEGKRKQDMTDRRIILDLCGGTGSWSKPYQEAGYDVRIITLPDYDVRTYIPPVLKQIDERS
jgi:hypothetical protein